MIFLIFIVVFYVGVGWSVFLVLFYFLLGGFNGYIQMAFITVVQSFEPENQVSPCLDIQAVFTQP